MRCGRAWPTASDPCGGADARTPQRTDPMAQAIVKAAYEQRSLPTFGTGQISPHAALSPPHWVSTQPRRLRLA